MTSTSRRILIVACLLMAAPLAVVPAAGAGREAPAGGIGTAVEWSDDAGASVVSFDSP